MKGQARLCFFFSLLFLSLSLSSFTHSLPFPIPFNFLIPFPSKIPQLSSAGLFIPFSTPLSVNHTSSPLPLPFHDKLPHSFVGLCGSFLTLQLQPTSNTKTIEHVEESYSHKLKLAQENNYVCCSQAEGLLSKFIGSQMILSWGQDVWCTSAGVYILQGFRLALLRSLFSMPSFFPFGMAMFTLCHFMLQVWNLPLMLCSFS